MIPERERGESLRTRDAVCGEPVPALERPDRRDEARAEVAVERTAILAGLQEQPVKPLEGGKPLEEPVPAP